MGRILKLLAKMKALDALAPEELERLMSAEEKLPKKPKILNDDEDSGWRTLEGGTKIHFSDGGSGSGGKIDKGPANMKGKTMGQVKAEGKAKTAARAASKPKAASKGSTGMKEPKGSGYDPQKPAGSERKLTKAAKQNLDRIAEACHEASAMCREKAKQWPDGSEERGIYEMYEKVMGGQQAGRPTKAESQALTQKFLGNISSQLKPYAVERYKKDLANEPQITSDLCDIADELGTEMFGLGFRLKKASNSADGGCRIAEKIAETMKEKKADGSYPTYEEAVDGLSDLVRYTQACTPDNMVEHFEKTRKALEKRGYKAVKIKNTWDSYSIKKAYRGVNCVFEAPNGTKFELQFHTPESLVGKEVQHPQYEEQRKPGTPQARFDELGQIMYKNMSGLKRPKNVEKIKNYP